MQKVLVAGIGITKFGEHWEKSLRELAVEASLQAINDAGIDKNKIDALWIGNMSSGRFIGQEHLGALIAGELGLNVPSTRIEAACASGGLAIRHAYLSILSGKIDCALVIGVEKMTDLPTEEATITLATASDQEWEAYYGVTFPGLYAMIAKRHMHDFGTTREQLALVAVKNHEHASLNPIAQFRNKITVEDVLSSSPVAEPLNLLDCSPITDGAAAILLCRENFVKVEKPVYLVASGHAVDTIALHERKSLTELKATKLAAKMAYEEAKIKPKEIDIAEVHDCFTIAEIIAYEDLGFCEKGEGGKLIEQGETRLNGSIPVNTSGGLKACGHPVGATGVKQAVEVVLQLREEAGKRQVKHAQRALTHNVGGSGATCVVHIWEKGF
ncbi:MAG TPA: thiolase domain-containing protein [Nanoarchaeota archaeon]|nr:thiolase domain-containing protein [Nanoarchaeota archaeon]